jgi:hypothetical protein
MFVTAFFSVLGIADLVSFVEDGSASQLYRTCSSGFFGAPACGGVALLMASNDGRAGCCCVAGVGAGGIFAACEAPLPIAGKKFDGGRGASVAVLAGSAVTVVWPVEVAGGNSGFAVPKLSLIAGMFASLFEAGCIKGDDVSGACVLDGKNEGGPAATEAGASVAAVFGANNDVGCAGAAPCERNENAPGDWFAAGDGFAPGDVAGANTDGADKVSPAVVGSACCMPGKKEVVGA